ncbi:MAG: hypothetical protein PWQ59_1128 [Thermoanaerobacterium sp.]|nr:hypothetical protein [Thermoanaerobacterium sp.]
MANVLLVEPDYMNKYPPLGLMKISTYHKAKGDTVIFCKGKNKELRKGKWDRIYVSTLFTFYWKRTINTIEYYYKSVNKPSDIYIGGVMATILYDDLNRHPSIRGVTVIPGLLDKPGMLGKDKVIVDLLPPDYSIIDRRQNKYLDYEYPTSDAYIAYATRGCIRKCEFCAVPIIEPEFNHYISIKDQVRYIKENFGEKRDLLLLDNNVLASKKLENIINDIIELGFGRDNNNYSYMKYGKKITVNRYVDFNQGTDARLLTEDKMKLLSKIAIHPLRIAFDHAHEEYVKLYVSKVRMAAEYGIKNLSNYILFNYTDTPEDFYNRLKINVELNEEFENKGYETRIWSFPMKYSPISGEHCKDRKYIGPKWNRKYLRGIHCILNSTHGVVGPKKTFFEKAFGRNIDEFKKIILMPEEYIIYREQNELNGNIAEWENDLNNLNDKYTQFFDIIKDKPAKEIEFIEDDNINNVLKHYKAINE